MGIRNYTNTGQTSTLVSAAGATDTTMALNNYAGDPTPPFTAALARGTATEEVVLVTAVSGSTVTVTRGYDGTNAQAQSAGATFQEVVVAQDYREANAHVNALAGAHGTGSALVGVSDVQTLTNKTLTTPSLSSPTMTGTATAATLNVTTLGVSGTATLGVTSTGALTAQSLTVPGTSTLTGALTANGGVSTTTLTTSGNATIGGSLTVATLTGGIEATAPLVLDEVADPAGLANKGQLYAKSDGGLYVQVGTTGVARALVHWGTGTTLPSNPLEGDVYRHTGLHCLMVYTSGSWRQQWVPDVADAAARTAISTTYSSVLYSGFRVHQTDVNLNYFWNGSAWVGDGFKQSGPNGVTVNTNGSGNFTVTHGLGVVPSTVWLIDATPHAFGGSTFAVDASASTATQFTARAYYQDQPNNSASLLIFWRVFA